MKRYTNTFTFLIPVLVFCLYPLSVGAAELRLQTDDKTINRGQDFLISVFLDTGSESVNAVEGKISFPNQFLQLKEIRDGNSVVNFWIRRPDTTSDDSISFSGITPGGFSGKGKFLFSIVFRALASPQVTIRWEEIRVLKNDGQGTAAAVTAAPLTLTIVSGPISATSSADIIVDTDPPEDFNPSIGQSQDIFDGQYFLAFSTQDKGIGIDHYEVKEGYFGNFIIAESPYLLRHQKLDKRVFVKAFDKLGNERVVSLPAENPSRAYQYALLVILLMVVISNIFSKKLWQKSLK